jgi:hypothetical protein
MKDGMDAVTRGARVRRLDRSFRWPGGRHVAVIFNLAYEAWSDGKAPGVGPMGNPLPAGTFDTNALSWGHYGTARGIDRLQRILDRNKVRGSVMTSGVLAERAPASIKALVDAGHEIVAHSYGQEIVPAQLSPEADRENIRRTTELLTEAGGVKPARHAKRGDRAFPARRRLRLARRRVRRRPALPAGARQRHHRRDPAHHGDQRPAACDAVRPLAAPVHRDVRRPPGACARRRGRGRGHRRHRPYPLLRPPGAWAYEQVVRRVVGRDDVHVARRDEIARHVRAAIRS